MANDVPLVRMTVNINGSGNTAHSTRTARTVSATAAERLGCYKQGGGTGESLEKTKSTSNKYLRCPARTICSDNVFPSSRRDKVIAMEGVRGLAEY